MTTRALGLGATFAVLLLLLAGLGILAMTRGGNAAAAGKSPAVVVMNVTPPMTTAPTVRGVPQARGAPAALPDDERATTGSPSEPAELAIAPIAKAYVQREDGSMRAKDAPPPVVRKTAIDGIRAAVTPAIQRCIAEGLARSPEQRELDARPSISIIYTVSSSRGALAVTSAQATINGTQDDALVTCAEAAYKAVRIQAPADQPDGEGKVLASFDYK